MSAPIIKLQRTCDACREAFHDVCEAWLGDLFDEPHRACPCPCRNESGDLTYQALVEMARRRPERTARMAIYREAFQRGSWGLHDRLLRGRR